MQVIEKNKIGRACGMYGTEQRKFWCIKLRETLERPRRRSEDIFEINPQQNRTGAWTGLIWLRREKGRGLL